MENTRLIELQTIFDSKGNLSIIEGEMSLPFEIQQISWFYDVKGLDVREEVGSDSCEKLIIALSGSCECITDDDKEAHAYLLNRPQQALYLPKGRTCNIERRSDSLCILVLSSGEGGGNRRERAEKPCVADGNIHILPQENTHHEEWVYAENNIDVPFNVKRVFYIYSIPEGQPRGAHAHKDCHQFLIAPCGSYEVTLDDGTDKRVVALEKPNEGLHVPPRVWASELNFATGAVCLVLASDEYSEDDYIRDYNDFLKYKDTLNK